MARQSPKKPTWQTRQKLMQALVEEAFQDDTIREVRDQVLALLQQAPLAVGPADDQAAGAIKRCDAVAAVPEAIELLFL